MFALGVALVGIPWETWPMANRLAVSEPFRALFRGLGEALVIACVVALLVDRAAKLKLLKEFAADVSTHIIGRRLPESLRKHIEPYLEADLIRTTWNITYVISDWPGHHGYDRLETVSVYEIENRSSSPTVYRCVYSVEKSLFPKIGETAILAATGNSIVDPKDAFDYPEQPELKPEDDDENGRIVFRKNVAIPAVRGSAYRFSFQSVECFRDGSIVPFFAKLPVLATTLTVQYPVARMKVIVDLSFGDIKKDAQPIKFAGGVQWVFNKPILPGQGFTMRFVKSRKD